MNLTGQAVYCVVSDWGLHSVHVSEESAKQWLNEGQRIVSHAVIDVEPTPCIARAEPDPFEPNPYGDFDREADEAHSDASNTGQDVP